MKFQTLLLGIVVCGTSVMGQDSPRVSSVEASSHVGRTATVCGTVVTFRCIRPEFTTFLDLDAPYWLPTFSVAINRTSRVTFGPGLEDRYRSRSVCVTGVIEKSDQGTRIVVVDASQLALASVSTEPQVEVEEPLRSCDDGVELPRPTREAKPRYTAAAMRAKIQGKVLLQGTVGTDGTVRNAEVVYSLDDMFGLDEEALRAFRQWRFEPGTYHGQPAPVTVTTEMSFVLRGR